jgi:hypothetical protein
VAAPQLPAWPKDLPLEQYLPEGVLYPVERVLALDARLEACSQLPGRCAKALLLQRTQDDLRLGTVVRQHEASCTTRVAQARADAPMLTLPTLLWTLGGLVLGVLGGVFMAMVAQL